MKRRWLIFMAIALALTPWPASTEGVDGEPVDDAVAVLDNVDLFDPEVYGDELPVETLPPDELPAPEISQLPEATEPLPEPTESLPEPDAPDWRSDQPALWLNADALTLGVRESCVLLAGVSDLSLAGTVTFSSSNPDVAAVSASGSVQGRQPGTAVITAQCGGNRVQCAVTVRSAPEYVALSRSEAVLGVGQSMQLSAQLSPDSFSRLDWRSSDPAVATVDDYGRVTAVGVGEATITATACNRRRDRCAITVKPAPNAIRLTAGTFTLGVGQQTPFAAALNAGSAGTLTCASSNPDVAAVEDGALIAKAVGSATITVQTYNGVSNTAYVRVLPAPESLALECPRMALGVGEALTLQARLPFDTRATLSWTTSEARVASVTASGRVTALSPGQVTITATAHNGVSASVTLDILKAPAEIAIAPSALTLAVGETANIRAVLPEGTASKVTFSCDNWRVARVDSAGRVQAMGAGSATITAVTANGRRASCAVKVYAQKTGE